MDKYEIQTVGARHHTEWWIPADNLETLNENIVGRIEVIEEFASDASPVGQNASLSVTTMAPCSPLEMITHFTPSVIIFCAADTI